MIGGLSEIRVKPDGPGLHTGWLTAGDFTVRCSLGRCGVIAAAEKREGDGASPIGQWPVRHVYYRADRLDRPQTSLPASPTPRDGGWCDAADDPMYNRFVSHPYPSSAEELWREDGLYDLVVILGHNDDPVVPGAGSAIFFHVAPENYGPTAGCVAVTRDDLLAILRQCGPETRMVIEGV